MITNTVNSLWVEKYRPNTLDTYIGNEKLKTKLTQYIADGDIPHLLFVGKPGTGKSTAAKILINSIPCDSKVINASNENNIDTVRGSIRQFASTRGFNPLKIMVLDEFDGFTRQGQEALRNLMEQFSQHTRFILTANYVERVIEPIVSRTQQLDVIPPSKKDTAIHLSKILKSEGIEYTPVNVKTIIDSYFPDIRKIINECQLHSFDGSLKIDEQKITEDDFKTKLIYLLADSSVDKDRFTTIRQHLADSSIHDYSVVYRTLYDKIDQYSKSEQIPLVILALAEGQYKDSLVVDKEINMMSTIINILNIIYS